jgi:hypothetical protein
MQDFFARTFNTVLLLIR